MDCLLGCTKNDFEGVLRSGSGDPFSGSERLKCLSQLQVESTGTSSSQPIIQPKVQSLCFIQRHAKASPIGIFQALEIDIFHLGSYIADTPEADGAQAPVEGEPVFGLENGLVLIPETAGIVAPHAIGATQGGQAAEGDLSR